MTLQPDLCRGVQVVGAGPGKGWPRVEGRCPACGTRSLFVASGAYVTCASLSCPDPSAASDLLAPETFEDVAARVIERTSQP